MSLDATQFIELVRDITDDGSRDTFALGTIPATYASGLPEVRFDSESVASIKLRPYLASYVPAANDRVLMARVGNGWVILGKVTS